MVTSDLTLCKYSTAINLYDALKFISQKSDTCPSNSHCAIFAHYHSPLEIFEEIRYPDTMVLEQYNFRQSSLLLLLRVFD